jgi:prophage regulatory protein
MQSRDLPDTVYRMPELERLTGLRAPTLWQKIREGTFPRPLKLGGRASGWLASEVAAWQRRRIAERDGEAA